MRTWKHPGGFGFAGLSPERSRRLSLWFLSLGRGRMDRKTVPVSDSPVVGLLQVFV